MWKSLHTSVSPTRGGAPQGQGPSSFFSCARLLTQHVGTTSAHHAQSFSCVQLCNLMDCSPPGSSFHGILQARILECLPPGDLPNPGIRARSPKLQADSLLSEPPGKTWCPLMLPKWIDGTLTFLKGLQYAPLSLKGMLLLTNYSFITVPVRGTVITPFHLLENGSTRR